MPTLPLTESEIDAFLAAFEGGKLPRERWTHSAHLFTGACYVHMLGEEPAIQRMRICIKHHNESVGTQNTDTGGYHETNYDRVDQTSEPIAEGVGDDGAGGVCTACRGAIRGRPRHLRTLLLIRSAEIRRGTQGLDST